MPLDDNVIFSTQVKKQQNQISSIMDFDYYRNVGLLTDDMIQSIAQYQRFKAAKNKQIIEASKIINQQKDKVTQNVGNINFCKLNVDKVINDNGYLCLHLNNKYTCTIQLEKKTEDQMINGQFVEGTIQKEYIEEQRQLQDGVIYRTDYQNTTSNKQFNWIVTGKYNDQDEFVDGIDQNGDPYNAAASLVYIVHKKQGINEFGIDYEKGYLRTLNMYGMDRLTLNTPVEVITLWKEYRNFSEQELKQQYDFYLFQSHSISGYLGAYESIDESIVQSLYNLTTISTAQHPVVYGDTNDLAKYESSCKSWCWWWDTQNEQLYFSTSGVYRRQIDWGKVYISEQTPTSSFGYKYWYNPRMSKLYASALSDWDEYKSDYDKKMISQFGAVIALCRQRDKYRKGFYDFYKHDVTQTLESGNYYFEAPYGQLITFSLPQTLSSGDKIVFDTDSTTTIKYYKSNVQNIILQKTKTAQTIKYHSQNILQNKYKMQDGDINGAGQYIMATPQQVVEPLPQIPDGTVTPPASGEQETPQVPEDPVVKPQQEPSQEEKQEEQQGSEEQPPQDAQPEQTKSTACRSTNFIKVYPNLKYKMEIAGPVDIEEQHPVKVVMFDSECNYIASTQFLYGYGQFFTAAVLGNTQDQQDSEQFNSTNGIVTSIKESLRRGYHKQCHYIKLVYKCAVQDLQSFPKIVISFANYKNSIIIGNQTYTKIDNIEAYNEDKQIKGPHKSIYQVMNNFVKASNRVYIDKYYVLDKAQKQSAKLQKNLSESLGQIYRQGTWQDDSYVASSGSARGDQQRLYKDALDNLSKISKPQSKYNISFIDLYSMQNYNKDYGVNELTSSVPWPDLSVTSAVHVIDDQIGIDQWAYIDKINKCYDNPRNTTISINTDLTTIGQHSFTDVISNIANVANSAKTKAIMNSGGSSGLYRGTIDGNSIINGTLTGNSFANGSIPWNKIGGLQSFIGNSISSALSDVTVGVIGLGTIGVTANGTIVMDQAFINKLVANQAFFNTLTADKAIIDKLVSNSAQFGYTKIDYAQITEADIDKLAARIAKIGQLNVEYANIKFANIDEGYFKQLKGAVIQAAKGQFGDIEVDTASIRQAVITDLKAEKAWITDAMIQNATISSAQIKEISADKITTGTLGASVVISDKGLFTSLQTMFLNGIRLPADGIDLNALSDGVITAIRTPYLTYYGTANPPTSRDYPQVEWLEKDYPKYLNASYCVVDGQGNIRVDGKGKSYVYRFTRTTRVEGSGSNKTIAYTYGWQPCKDDVVSLLAQQKYNFSKDIAQMQQTNTYIQNQYENVTGLISTKVTQVLKNDQGVKDAVDAAVEASIENIDPQIIIGAVGTQITQTSNRLDMIVKALCKPTDAQNFDWTNYEDVASLSNMIMTSISSQIDYNGQASIDLSVLDQSGAAAQILLGIKKLQSLTPSEDGYITDSRGNRYLQSDIQISADYINLNGAVTADSIATGALQSAMISAGIMTAGTVQGQNAHFNSAYITGLTADQISSVNIDAINVSADQAYANKVTTFMQNVARISSIGQSLDISSNETLRLAIANNNNSLEKSFVTLKMFRDSMSQTVQVSKDNTVTTSNLKLDPGSISNICSQIMNDSSGNAILSQFSALKQSTTSAILQFREVKEQTQDIIKAFKFDNNGLTITSQNLVNMNGHGTSARLNQDGLFFEDRNGLAAYISTTGQDLGRPGVDQYQSFNRFSNSKMFIGNAQMRNSLQLGNLLGSIDQYGAILWTVVS